MKKKYLLALVMITISLSAFTFHKFYSSIYQIHFVPEKKMLQITSRIFIEDLNNVLSKNYKQKTHIGEANETATEVGAMKNYFLKHFSIIVNGQPKPLNYLSKEIDGNVLVCYFNIKEISKIKTLKLQNTLLFELNSEQQNIIQTNIYEKKQSLFFTNNNHEGDLNFQ